MIRNDSKHQLQRLRTAITVQRMPYLTRHNDNLQGLRKCAKQMKGRVFISQQIFIAMCRAVMGSPKDTDIAEALIARRQFLLFIYQNGQRKRYSVAAY